MYSKQKQYYGLITTQQSQPLEKVSQKFGVSLNMLSARLTMHRLSDING